MCFICDGGTTDEYDQRVTNHIDTVGWHVVGVEPSRHKPMWGYTIGLSERFGHPELVEVDGCCFEHLLQRLNGIGGRVAAGERFAPGDEVFDDEGRSAARIGAVHRDEWTTNRFNGWLNYYGSKPWQPPPLQAVQVLWRRQSGEWQNSRANRRWPADNLAWAPAKRPKVRPGHLRLVRDTPNSRARARRRPAGRQRRAHQRRRRS